MLAEKFVVSKLLSKKSSKSASSSSANDDIGDISIDDAPPPQQNDERPLNDEQQNDSKTPTTSKILPHIKSGGLTTTSTNIVQKNKSTTKTSSSNAPGDHDHEGGHEQPLEKVELGTPLGKRRVTSGYRMLKLALLLWLIGLLSCVCLMEGNGLSKWSGWDAWSSPPLVSPPASTIASSTNNTEINSTNIMTTSNNSSGSNNNSTSNNSQLQVVDAIAHSEQFVDDYNFIRLQLINPLENFHRKMSLRHMDYLYVFFLFVFFLQQLLLRTLSAPWIGTGTSGLPTSELTTDLQTLFQGFSCFSSGLAGQISGSLLQYGLDQGFFRKSWVFLGLYATARYLLQN